MPLPRPTAWPAALAALAVLALLVTLVWRPLQAARATAIADIHAYEAVSAQVRASGPRLAQRAAQSRAPAATFTRPLPRPR